MSDPLDPSLPPPPDPNATINMVARDGSTHAVRLADVAAARLHGFEIETSEAAADRISRETQEDIYSAPGAKVVAAGAGALRGLTGGLSDVALSGIYGDEGQAQLRALKEQNPGISTAGDIGGALLGVALTGGANLGAAGGTKAASLGARALASTPAGLASRAGAAVSALGEGGGAIARVGAATVGGAIEGGLQGLGAGVSDLALSEDPLTWDRAVSVLSSNALFGAAAGGLVGGAFKGTEVALERAGATLAKANAARTAQAQLPEALEDASATELKLAAKAEREALEGARAPERQAIADDIAAYRRDLKEQKIWLATASAEDRELREIGKRTLKADKAVDNLLDEPISLGEDPTKALRSLRIQRKALEDLEAKAPAIRAEIAAKRDPAVIRRDILAKKIEGEVGPFSEGGIDAAVERELGRRFPASARLPDGSIAPSTRETALDQVAAALERNRQLQKRIADLASPPTSPLLTAIEDAQTAMQGGGKTTLGERALRAIPGVGTVEAVFGGLKKAGQAVTKRAETGVKAMLDVSKRAAPYAPVLATKVLGSVRYAKERPDHDRGRKLAAAKLPDLYKERAEELRSQVAIDPATGQYEMTLQAREDLGRKLAPIAAVNPIAADKMETTAARRLAFLAGKLPTRPDLDYVQIGPDLWQPSEMEMRTFARYAAAVEDPYAVIERMASGAVTPEDAEALRTVYPEIYADMQRMIIEQLPTLRKTLPYARRLALSMFSGVPVDPAMTPMIIDQLQKQYVNEPNTEGGVQAPVAQPAFGSVRSEQATPAQQRQGAQV